MSTLSGIVKRRFIHLVNNHHQTVSQVVESMGITPGDLCLLIAGKEIPLIAYYRIAQWLRMPFVNVITLAGIKPRLSELIRAGMEHHGCRASSSQDQIKAAKEAGISVAVFRRALHGYASFSPSLQTCERLALWLAWTGYEMDDIANAAGMIIAYHADGQSTILSQATYAAIQPYPCACGRAGCMIPAHIPEGPRRKWRSDACRMWANRHSPTGRFITINERFVPVRFRSF